ncbi:MAG: hypothetical protein KJ754_12600 [Bacteroidetes bacterium]|nr:hypothetical protein [Bacteroidota bacterium]MBU1580263.1 hypothetical protein [Bacteroidota bacterium]MBU2465129.1 hypothetical protein [Bacteroidota bacterium]MBU2613877.1 hypothetical protein [Patescibacteria group bacterium]
MKNQKNFIKTTLVAGALISGGAALNVQAENAFTANLLGSGSEVRSALSTKLFTPIPDLKFELKCGEATQESKTKEAKCGEANKESKTKEAKCGEGRCGEGEKKAEKSSEKKADLKTEQKTEKKAEKKSESKSSEAKCGEGKCGTF